MRFIISMIVSFSFVFAVALNTASKKELMSLKYVGVKKAEAIIKYRKEKGCFKSIEEFVKVKGVGPKTLERNRDNLEVGTCSNE